MQYVVVAFQMLGSRVCLSPTAFHLQRLSCQVLEFFHILLAEFARLARLVVHPVPDDMGMQVGHPRFGIVGIYIMSLVTVDVNLYGAYSPPLLHLLNVLL